MFYFLRGFTLFLVGYFIIYVTGSHYLSGLPYSLYFLPLVKEGLWFCFILYIISSHRLLLWEYVKKTKIQLVLLVSIAVRGIIATILFHGVTHETVLNITIGLKYGLYASIIFYTAAAVGYIGIKDDESLIKFIHWIVTIVAWSCIVGLFWQGCKRLFPHIFYDILGYGPVGDYQLGQPHPIYYRTGAGGMPRFSGLFSGPNNLGYLLVGYASLVMICVRSWFLRSVFYLTTIMTLSRAALLGSGVQGLVQLIRLHWKKFKLLIIIAIVVAIVSLISLSVMKWGSTVDHFTRTIDALQQVIQYPEGKGLGSSGPGVHRNGSVLPENFYLQLLIDYGTVPFMLWCAYRYSIIRKIRTSQLANQPYGSLIRGYSAGLVGMFIIGMFLHVFEDSIVNYLFFVPFGLLWGYAIYSVDTLAKKSL